MNPSQHAEQFQSQLANYVPQFTPEFWPVWLIIAGVLLVGMWLVLGLHALLRARGVKKSATDHGEKVYLYSKAVRLWHWSNAFHDGERVRFAVAIEGENNIRAGVRYRLNEQHQFVEC